MCLLCQLRDWHVGGRYYEENEEYVVFDGYVRSVTGVYLIACTHGRKSIPADAFLFMQDLGQKLYGEGFLLEASPPEAPHYYMRLLPLKLGEQSYVQAKPCVLCT